MLKIEVGKAYINAQGYLVEIVEKRFNFYVDRTGKKYSPTGKSLGGSLARRLVDQALSVVMEQCYEINWRNGGTSRYKVVGIGSKGYEVRWDEADLAWIPYGCPLNLNSKLVEDSISPQLQIKETVNV